MEFETGTSAQVRRHRPSRAKGAHSVRHIRNPSQQDSATGSKHAIGRRPYPGYHDCDDDKRRCVLADVATVNATLQRARPCLHGIEPQPRQVIRLTLPKAYARARHGCPVRGRAACQGPARSRGQGAVSLLNTPRQPAGTGRPAPQRVRPSTKGSSRRWAASYTGIPALFMASDLARPSPLPNPSHNPERGRLSVRPCVKGLLETREAKGKRPIFPGYGAERRRAGPGGTIGVPGDATRAVRGCSGLTPRGGIIAACTLAQRSWRWSGSWRSYCLHPPSDRLRVAAQPATARRGARTAVPI